MKSLGYLKNLKKNIPIVNIQKLDNEIILVVLPKYLLIVMSYLKKHISTQYQVLSCVSGVDIIGKKYRFSIVYDLLSITYNTRIRIKTFVNEITSVPSITNIYPNANWWEREVWDLFGIFFTDHPDLRRILTDYGFEGWALRKDFPLTGYEELRFSEIHKKIVHEPVELSQNLRYYVTNAEKSF